VQNTLDEHVLVALKDKFGEKLQVRVLLCDMPVFILIVLGLEVVHVMSVARCLIAYGVQELWRGCACATGM
jgi:hypothetical protein